MLVLVAADSSANGAGVWAYLAILAATAAGYMGVPFIGTAAIGAAAVFASQGKLNIAAVLIVAVIGNEVGGLLGYKIGDRWGRRILEHPGPALEWRKKTLAKGEAIYQKWGRLAVFFTPALVSGALRMKFGQFVAPAASARQALHSRQAAEDPMATDASCSSAAVLRSSADVPARSSPKPAVTSSSSKIASLRNVSWYLAVWSVGLPYRPAPSHLVHARDPSHR